MQTCKTTFHSYPEKIILIDLSLRASFQSPTFRMIAAEQLKSSYLDFLRKQKQCFTPNHLHLSHAPHHVHSCVYAPIDSTPFHQNRSCKTSCTAVSSKRSYTLNCHHICYWQTYNYTSPTLRRNQEQLAYLPAR